MEAALLPSRRGVGPQLEAASQELLDLGRLGYQPAFGSGAIVHLDVHGHAREFSGKQFEALSHQTHRVGPFAGAIENSSSTIGLSLYKNQTACVLGVSIRANCSAST